MTSIPACTRNIPELLSPAGTMDAFKAALAAGADAIYCGLGVFNARRNADNLDLEQLKTACELAHLAGSRVYVTTNILIADDELPRALALVRDCHLAGADAFIMADWGFIKLVRELWPQIEIHLSTQANVHDSRGVAFAREHGCSRVTLSREMTLEEIEECSHENVELEIFAHGAICVSYSGQCLLSSMQRGRSANRGLCRQPCRLPYQIVDGKGRDLANVSGSRLLSPRDNCTIADIPGLVKAGCSAMKLEGRMKAPDYVGTVTDAYRTALDEFAAGLEPTADPAVMRELARAFNRDFTDGYLHGKHDNDFMSYERGNNRGQYGGKVVQANGKNVVLRLVEPVGEGDLLEIRNPERFDDYVTVPSPKDMQADSDLLLSLPRAMGCGCDVRVIRSERGMAQAREFAGRAWPRKRRVNVRVKARIGQPFTVVLETLENDCHPDIKVRQSSAKAEGFVVEPARSKAVTEEDLIGHVGRFGTSPFEAVSWEIDLDEGAGMSFSAVHAVRADAVELLKAAILDAWTRAEEDVIPAPCSIKPLSVGCVQRPEPLLCALVTNPQDAWAALEAGTDLIYANALDLSYGSNSSARRHDAEPSDVAWPEGVIPLLGEVSRAIDREYADAYIHTDAEVVVGTVSSLALASDIGAHAWTWNTLPCHNHAAFMAMKQAGAEGIWISPELDLLEIGQLARSADINLGMTVYGRIRTMTTEHCILQSLGDCQKTCATCKRRSMSLTLRDEFDRPALVTSDVLGRSKLWQPEVYDATPQIPELLSLGVSRFLVDCQVLQGDETVTAAVKKARLALDQSRLGRQPAPRASNTTSGHLFERIG